MNCPGKYKYRHYELECKKELECDHYTIRTRRQGKPPRSKTKECEFFKKYY